MEGEWAVVERARALWFAPSETYGEKRPRKCRLREGTKAEGKKKKNQNPPLTHLGNGLGPTADSALAGAAPQEPRPGREAAHIWRTFLSDGRAGLGEGRGARVRTWGPERERPSPRAPRLVSPRPLRALLPRFRRHTPPQPPPADFPPPQQPSLQLPTPPAPSSSPPSLRPPPPASQPSCSSLHLPRPKLPPIQPFPI